MDMREPAHWDKLNNAYLDPEIQECYSSGRLTMRASTRDQNHMQCRVKGGGLHYPVYSRKPCFLETAAVNGFRVKSRTGFLIFVICNEHVLNVVKREFS